MKEILIKMKNRTNNKMAKRILLISILFLFLLSYVSAFCTTQGYILDEDGDRVDATKINVVCKRITGDLLYTQPAGNLFGFPFGDWYDDCSYCDQGVFFNAINSVSNGYDEFLNMSCTINEVKFCHTNMNLETVPSTESASSKDNYANSAPDVGPLVENPEPMPKGNATPEEKITSIKESLHPSYTRLYFSIVLILLIIVTIILIRKYGK